MGMPAFSKINDDEQKHEHGQVFQINVSHLSVTSANERIYRPISLDSPDIVELAESIQKDGLKTPLTITTDNVILSGNRRFAAVRRLGWKTVSVIMDDISSDDPDFLRQLTIPNKQRNKTFDEKFREKIIEIDKNAAYSTLIGYREKQAELKTESFKITGSMNRSGFSEAKKPFLEKVIQIIYEKKDYWPLTDRQIHYLLLNDPPVINATFRKKQFYKNDKNSYRALTDILSRGRLNGRIDWQSICDSTRPVSLWECYQEPSGFIEEQTKSFLNGYYRDLLQSQPNHIEIVAEKLTIQSLIKPIAGKYCMPLTIGRGYSSLIPRKEIADRYFNSGKEKLILIILSDFDPAGEEIAMSLARSLRDDFGISNLHPIKAALTLKQAKKYKLPANIDAKKTDSNYNKFIKKNKTDSVWELEALPPEKLKELLDEAIRSVIDIDLFNAEVDAEADDSREILAKRETLLEAMT